MGQYTEAGRSSEWLGGSGRECTALSSVGVSTHTALSFCRYGISNDGKTRVLLGNFTIPQATTQIRAVSKRACQSTQEYPNALALPQAPKSVRNHCGDSPRSLP